MKINHQEHCVRSWFVFNKHAVIFDGQICIKKMIKRFEKNYENILSTLVDAKRALKGILTGLKKYIQRSPAL